MRIPRRNLVALAVGIGIGLAAIAWQSRFVARPTSRPDPAVIEHNLANLRRIAATVELYRTDRDGAYPDSLDALFRFADFLSADAVREMTTDPVTGLCPGYVYVEPVAGADPARTPMLYERRANGAVAYADGHVEPTRSGAAGVPASVGGELVPR